MLWLVLGLIIGALFYHFAAGARSGKYRVRWYQWPLAVLAAALFLLTVQNYQGFQAELEPGEANLMLVLLGVPTLVTLALVWLLPLLFGRRGKATTGVGQKPA